MAPVKLLDLQGGNDRPDLFFGVVAAVGTPWKELETYLAKGLRARGYQEVQTVRVSERLEAIKSLKRPYPGPQATAFERISQLMDRGNELRERTRRKEALALVTAAYIAQERARLDKQGVTKRAFLIHQLKHPDEVLWLRHVYGRAFHLLAIFSPHSDRRTFLMKDRGGMPSEDADALILRDADEGKEFGQNVRGTFHLADLFMTYNTSTLDRELERFLSLLFGQPAELPGGKKAFISPTKIEYGMYLAHAAALRSADLSRQVGASILDSNGDVLALGTNEVPAAGGGQYWEEAGRPDARDFVRGRDYNEFKRTEIVAEILDKLAPFMKKELTSEQKEQLSKELEGSTIADLTEFGRAVHAEMEAILSAGRRGVSVRGAKLYTTAFPCHNCAKHIVDAGITQATYIEPYPKSKALEMHGDSIVTTDFLIPSEHGTEPEPEAWRENRVLFSPFVGVAPRRYSEFFSYSSDEGERWRRKEKGAGGAVSFKEAGIRLRGPTTSISQREELAVRAANEMEAELAK